MASKVIEVKNLSKIYKDAASRTVALDNVSFDVNQGESLAIIGPSGSGKTTLLELMAGLNKPSKGIVKIDGKNINKEGDAAISAFRNKYIGFVFQMMHLQDYFTAAENVGLPMIAAGVSKKERKQRAEELLKMVSLENRMNYYPKNLSGGEMQRVALARALANNPKIIMADEPTGKLDRANSDKVMDILTNIGSKGVSIILITHDEKVAARFSRSLYLEHGKLTNN